MARLNVLLVVALLISCFWLIRSSYDSRRLYDQLEKAQNQEHELQSEGERLQLDKRAQATPLRVEKLAREKLRMLGASPAATQYVSAAASREEVSK
ncbi:MAG: cell division protein FtsL [Burkholderiales bacterium]|nr:cell division protein FtsL [Burkholderiales bacterium]